MFSRKDAARGLLTVLLGLGSLGCPNAGLPPAPPANGPAISMSPRTPPAQPEPVSAFPATEESQAGEPVSTVAPDTPAVDSLTELRRLHQRAAERNASMDTYIARLRRREQVNGKNRPEEVLLFKFRKDPWSVYFKWVGPTGKSREAVYVRGRHDDKLHTLLAAGDMPFAPAGKQVALSPDSLLVRSNSRHSIRDAGIGALIDRFGHLLARPVPVLEYKGPMLRPEYGHPLEEVVQTIAATEEPELPGGGLRHWYFDPQSGLPVLIITWDSSGQEVEFYCYDRILCPVQLDDDDFDPKKLWTAPRPG